MAYLEIASISGDKFSLKINGEDVIEFHNSYGEFRLGKVIKMLDVLAKEHEGISVNYPDILTCNCCHKEEGLEDRFTNEVVTYKGKSVHFKQYCHSCIWIEKRRFIKSIDEGSFYIDRFTEKKLKRSYRRKGSNRGSLSNKRRLEVLQRDKSTCQMCGAKAPEVELHIDHIIPVSKGGSNEIDNLQVLCKPCNLAKSNRHVLHINK